MRKICYICLPGSRAGLLVAGFHTTDESSQEKEEMQHTKHRDALWLRLCISYCTLSRAGVIRVQQPGRVHEDSGLAMDLRDAEDNWHGSRSGAKLTESGCGFRT